MTASIFLYSVGELDRRCDACNGIGKRHTAEFNAWYDEYRRDGFPPVDEYVRSHPKPVEFIPCTACEGIGFILTPRGRRLKEFFQRHLTTGEHHES